MAMSAEEKAAWLSARAGKLTASRMADAMDFRKDGKPGAARSQYMRELLAERVTGLSVPHVVNDAMLWGSEHEDEAVDLFVEMTGRDVKLSRFYEHPTIPNFGCTPDRELDDGLLEVKCPQTATFLEWVMAGVVPERHKPQMTAQLIVTGKPWCGFIAWDGRIRDERRRLFLRKFVPTAAERSAVEAAAVQFLDELEAMFSAFVSAPLGVAA
jgi:putative phage-type endonuclease